MTDPILSPLRVLGTQVLLSVPFRNSELMRRTLARWKGLVDDPHGPGNRSTAPFLGTGEIMGGIRFIAQPGRLTLEVGREGDDALATTMLALAADTLRSDDRGEVDIFWVGRKFEVPVLGSGPLLDMFKRSSGLAVNGSIPDVSRLDLRYVIGASTLSVLVSKGRPLRHPNEPSDQFQINAIVRPNGQLEADGIISFLQAWPEHRTMMHHIVEYILGMEHA